MKIVEILGRADSIYNYTHIDGAKVYTVNAAQFKYMKDYGSDPTYAFWMDDFSVIQREFPGWAHSMMSAQWPIISCKAYKEFPWIHRYPIAHVLRHLNTLFPHLKLSWLNNTTAYAIVYAIWKGYEEIHLHGVDFYHDGADRSSELGCVSYWCGVAAAAGCKVVVNPRSQLLESDMSDRLYGYDVQPDVEHILQEAN